LHIEAVSSVQVFSLFTGTLSAHFLPLTNTGKYDDDELNKPKLFIDCNCADTQLLINQHSDSDNGLKSFKTHADTVVIYLFQQSRLIGRLELHRLRSSTRQSVALIVPLFVAAHCRHLSTSVEFLGLQRHSVSMAVKVIATPNHRRPARPSYTRPLPSSWCPSSLSPDEQSAV